ncbi:hypothetical protein [Rossellomorea marisflavi]|uniref:hypothetical protein n=1 Tax=Rossellomorea marisflavi TaxID=189381 RepID=UPI00345B01AE
MGNCKVCGHQASIAEVGFDDSKINCDYCGRFIITSDALESLSSSGRNVLAVLLREREINKKSPLAIFLKNKEDYVTDSYRLVTLEELISTFPKNVSERIDRTLLNLANVTRYPGQTLHITERSKTLFFTQTMDTREMFFLMQQLIDDGLISGHTSIPSELTVTVKGWNRIADLEIEQKSQDSDQAFVAMWFGEEMNSVAEKMLSAIKAAGFKAVRIDKKEHNNKIDDEIIAEIKKSKFVVADFTGHRGGVYFEAGFGMGLGKPVIWTCREDSLSELHFDTRQYSHIVWKDEDELYSKLLNRIRATIN